MNVFRVLFLTIIFALSMLFLVQNTQVLDTRANLILDLWWVRFSSPEIAFYLIVFLALIFGVIFGAVTFFPGNKELRENLRLLKIKIKSLTQEIIDMQKKEDVQDEKQEEKKEPEPVEEARPGYSPMEEDVTIKTGDKDMVIRTGGAAGKTALVGVFAVFILLVAFYFYVDQKISEYQRHMDLVTEESASVAVSTQRMQQDISSLSRSLQEHEEEISALQNLPQETMDFLTMMLINEYQVKVDQLIERAETEEDREMLGELLESLEKTLEYYRDKVD